MPAGNASHSYDQITSAMHHQIDFVGGIVRDYLAEGKHGHAESLAHTLWGAQKLWERITRGNQRDGDALKIEQAIEKLQKEIEVSLALTAPSQRL